MGHFAAIKIYLHPKIISICALGFVSGLPFPMTFATLSFWLAEENISKSMIGLFAFVGTPFVIKFIWAPLLDHLPIPIMTKALGRRRSWILISQIGIIFSLIALGTLNPITQLWQMAALALITSIFAATQDIGIDAFRIETLDEHEQGIGAAAIVFGWRIGALISGAGTLFIASYYSWAVAYSVMALLMIIGILTILIAKEPAQATSSKTSDIKKWLLHAIFEPFSEFASRNGWVLILSFIILFKLGDAVALSMLSPFAVELGFSKEEYATIVKIYGTIATLVGTFIGGSLIYKYGLIYGLWIAAITQMLSTFAFVWQTYMGHDVMALTITISLENFASGLGTAAFVAYLSSLCNIKFTATQYALFSSLAAMGRTWFSASSGFLADGLGWASFFTLCALAAIPGMILLYIISRNTKLHC